jgi:hypothetical protein
MTGAPETPAPERRETLSDRLRDPVRQKANWAAVRATLKWYARAFILALALALYCIGYGRGALEGWRECNKPPAARPPD